MSKKTVKKNSKGSKTAAKKSKKIFSYINKFMPYILAVTFVVFMFSALGFAGKFGNGLSNFLGGLVSKFATHCIWIFMLYHALMWYYDVNRKICARRVTCSFIMIFLVASMQQVIEASKHPELSSASISQLYKFGADGHGGGVIGGAIGKLLSHLGTVGAVAVIVFILLFMILQMFNITPASIIRSLSKSDEEKISKIDVKAKKLSRKQKPHKNFDVYDEDDDDIDEDNLDSLSLSDTNIPSDGPYDDEEDFDESDFDKSVKPEFSDTLSNSSQLKPYNEDDFSTSSEEIPDEYKTDITYGDDQSDSAEFEFSKKEYGSNFLSNEKEDEEEKEIDIADYVTPEVYEKITVKEEEKEPLNVEKKPLFGIFKRTDKEEREKPVKEKSKPKKKHLFPPIDFLNPGKSDEDTDEIKEELQNNARTIVETLNSFNIKTRIVDCVRGPTVTRYELVPEAGVRIKSIMNLSEDIAMNLGVEGIIIGAVPGAVGIEVPNKITSFVYLRSLLEDPKFKNSKSSLFCALGKSISGENIYLDIEKMPHLLVAGATGMGKSVCINSLLVSLLYKSSPDDVRLILIDPKRVELSNYNGIPHLLVPVVCEPKKSLGTLQWAVSEMEKRFEMIENAKVRNIIEYNDKIEKGLYDGEKMSRIVIIIDELADLKMAVPEIEDHIMRLTQKARAAGIHIIIGTQRPSVDVITGVIKSNIPSRIAFRVPSQVDSRTILDEVGADKLVSRGDMLFKPVGALSPLRVQGAFITADEIESVINFLKENASENYDEEVMHQIDSNAQKLEKNNKKDVDDISDGDGLDPKFYEALEIVVGEGKASSSRLQRKLEIGFQRAARLIDQMEDCGYIAEANGSKPRDVLITKEELYELRMRNENSD